LSIGAVNLGIFLSTFARTELQVIQFIPLVIVPQGLLGGLLFPVNQLPDVLNVVAHALPLTYAIEGLREVVLKGADLSSTVVQTDLLVLAGIALFFIVLASTTSKREVACPIRPGSRRSGEERSGRECQLALRGGCGPGEHVRAIEDRAVGDDLERKPVDHREDPPRGRGRIIAL